MSTTRSSTPPCARSGARRSDNTRAVPQQQDARTRRDRLEVLTALINGPEFDPALRGLGREQYRPR